MTKTPEELTEEWKAGKLEYGWYWIKHKTRGTIPEQYIPGDDWFVSNGFCITKILAPCNYDEYYVYAQFKPCGYEIAQKALKKIGFEKCRLKSLCEI